MSYPARLNMILFSTNFRKAHRTSKAPLLPLRWLYESRDLYDGTLDSNLHGHVSASIRPQAECCPKYLSFFGKK